MIPLRNYLLLSTIFVAIDSFYLSSVSGFFNKQIKDIQGEDLVLKIFPTFLCYITLSIGLYYFGIIKKFTIKECFALGLFTYAVFETTNMAIFRKWRWMTVIMDSIWIGCLDLSFIYLTEYADTRKKNKLIINIFVSYLLILFATK